MAAPGDGGPGDGGPGDGGPGDGGPGDGGPGDGAPVARWRPQNISQNPIFKSMRYFI